MTKLLETKLKMKLLTTPPKSPGFIEFRSFFDSQPEYLRRAFYSMGNYIAAQEVLSCEAPVIMDRFSKPQINTCIYMSQSRYKCVKLNHFKNKFINRFWHSTAAYAFANHTKDGGPAPTELDLTWPDDLLQPDLVIFLEVSEQERLRRHGDRAAFTNTDEEKTLAADALFRKR